jgi:peptide/nickel transport system ATP-binding protein
MSEAPRNGSDSTDSKSPLISVRDLTVDYWTGKNNYFRAVDVASFDLFRGEVVGLAGESGSGKSTIANALLALIDPPSKVTGEIMFGKSNILHLNHEQIQAYRWKLVSMIFQRAMNSLDPVFPISYQIVETIRAHDASISKEDALKITLNLLERVGIDHRRGRDYPHQLSGGMRQRVMIAMALVLKPKLLIADEPTSALDVVTQRQIISLLRQLRAEYDLSVLFITHDLPILSEISDRIIVMRNGKIVEAGDRVQIIQHPTHEYTQLLIKSVPTLTGEKQSL